MVDLLAPPEGGEEARAFTRVLLLFSALVVIIVSSLATLHAFVYPEPLLMWTWLAVAALVGAVPLVFRWTGNRLFATNYFIGFSLFAISWTAFWTGALFSPSIFWLTTLPLTAALLVGTRSAIAFALATVSAIAAFAVIESMELAPVSLLDARGVTIHVNQSLFGLLAYSIAVAATYVRRTEANLQVLADSAERNQQLVRVVCHDLGTPLLVVQGHTEALEARLGSSEELAELKRHSVRVGDVLDELRQANREADSILRQGALPSGKTGEVPMSRVSKLGRWLAPAEADAADIRGAGSLVLITGLVALMTFAFAGLDFIAGGTTTLRIIWCAVGISYGLPLALYKRSGSIALATSSFVATGLAAVAAMALLTGGLNSPTLHWIAAPPLVMAMLLGGRTVPLYSIVCGAILLLFFGLDAADATPNSLLPSQLFELHWVQTLVGLDLVMVLVSLIFVSQTQVHRDALERTREQNQHLVQSVCVGLSESLGELRRSYQPFTGVESVAKNLSAMERASTTMEEIVSDVRELNQQLLDMDRLQVEPVHVMSCVEEACSSLQARLSERGQEIRVDRQSDPDCHVSFVGSTPLSHQVLGNLLGNAIKFSPDGACIDVELREEGADLILEVRDRGTGIEKRLLPTLFRADLGGSTLGLRGEKGTGFGLPIAKSYVDASGGQLSVKTVHQSIDADGSGTTFTVRLPKVGLS